MVKHRWNLASLQGLRAVLALALVCSVVWAWHAHPHPTPLSSTIVAPQPQTEPEHAMHDLSWYAPLWQRDLQQELFPTETTTPVQEEPTVPLPVLLATCVEPRASYAHLRDRHGRVQMKTIDDIIDGYRLAHIEGDRVQLTNGAGAHWVALPKKMP